MNYKCTVCNVYTYIFKDIPVGYSYGLIYFVNMKTENAFSHVSFRNMQSNSQFLFVVNKQTMMGLFRKKNKLHFDVNRKHHAVESRVGQYIIITCNNGHCHHAVYCLSSFSSVVKPAFLVNIQTSEAMWNAKTHHMFILKLYDLVADWLSY